MQKSPVMVYKKVGSNQYSIPTLGFGTWKIQKREASQSVVNAIDIGYRHIDCAPAYRNEKEIGAAISFALATGRVKRDELWITSKLWNNAHGRKHVRPALERTLYDLQLDYLDLFLIHWPIHFRPGIFFPKRAEDFLAQDAIPTIETWQAMEKMVKKDLCRTIGVCNFNLIKLTELQGQAKVKPAINQIELHPYLQQKKMLKYCATNGILLTAYSPLGSARRPTVPKERDVPALLNHHIIKEIADKYGVDPAQVLIAWGLARDTVVISKSINHKRLQENFCATGLELTDSDLLAINTLDIGYRFVDGIFNKTLKSPYDIADLWQDG